MDPKKNHQDPGCFATTFERKYYRRGDVFIKRTLRPKEFRVGFRGLHVPRLNKERLMNEAESLRFIRSKTNIPVPKVFCDFEDDGAYYLITEYIPGVNMSDLSDEGKDVVRKELYGHLTILKTLSSNCLGGPSGIVIAPHRVMRRTETDYWTLLPSNHDEYVFCHNDLSQHNVIVDPDTFKINAIIDREYAGFYPSRFEWPFFARLGPSSAVEGEEDDSYELLGFLNSRVVTYV
jgi:serine/threonine protein kinase